MGERHVEPPPETAWWTHLRLPEGERILSLTDWADQAVVVTVRAVYLAKLDPAGFPKTFMLARR